MNPSGTGFGLAFLIFAVPSGTSIPGVGAYHYPALGERKKASGAFGAFLHFNPPPGTRGCEPRVQVMIVRLAIATDDGESRELVRADLGKEVDGSDSILQRRARDQHDEQQANGVEQHMAFAPFNFLAPLISSLRTSDFRRFD